MSIFNRFLGKKEDPEVRGYIECMLLLACADGELESDELDDIFVKTATHPKMEGLTWHEIKSIAMRSLSAMEKEGEDARIRSLAKLLPTQDVRIGALEMCLSVSLSDGELEPDEAEVLGKIQLAFGISDEQIEAMIGK
jgi:tellurite resistance protein